MQKSKDSTSTRRPLVAGLGEHWSLQWWSPYRSSSDQPRDTHVGWQSDRSRLLRELGGRVIATDHWTWQEVTYPAVWYGFEDLAALMALPQRPVNLLRTKALLRWMELLSRS